MIERLEKLTASTSAISNPTIYGRYDWYDEEGTYIASCEVEKTISWTAKKSQNGDVINIEINREDLHRLIERSTDPLLLLNTGKVRAYYHDYPADAEIRTKLELLLNQMLSKQNAITDRAKRIFNKSHHLSHLSGYLTLDNVRSLLPFLPLGIPAYISRGISEWKLFSLSKKEIVDLSGRETQVSILMREHGASPDQGAEYTSMLLSEYVKCISDPAKSSEVGYMAANTLPENLQNMVSSPDIFTIDSFNVPRWWIGGAGTGLKLHRDLIDNFLCQIKGKKRVTFFSPLESDNLYPCSTGGNPLYEPSQFDVSKPDYKKYPRASNAKAFSLELSEGDLMYIPAGWWHAIENVTESWSVNYFAVNREPSILLNS